jgi:uncharacterized PurR-regulated membrane protein YhhQ (DUF165 family)
MKIKESKRNVLFLVLGAFFIANAIIAEFIGVKIFSLEQTLGFDPFNLKLWGGEYSFNMTAGVLLWPVVFVMTDIINEYFGKHGVRLFSYIAAALIAYSFLMVYMAIQLTPGRFLENKRNCRRPFAHAKCVHTNFRTRVVDYHRFAGGLSFRADD